MTPNNERVILALLESDPDEVVDLLKISSRELILRFSDKVDRYIKGELDYEQDEEEYD